MDRARRIILLASLYLAQGMPFGFQANALPAYLREHGLSRTSIGFFGALSLPWMLKPLWAPFVDRYFDRRVWIVTLLIGMAVTAFVAAGLDATSINTLAGVVLVMNFFAATQDIAVDGLAVDILAEDELGPGNAAQVVGYKVGMLAGGGILVAASADLGWRGVFLGMGVVFSVVAIVATRIPAQRARSNESIQNIREVLRRIVRASSTEGALWLLLFIGTYKFGETLIDAMFKPFLFDVGYSPQQIGAIVGTYGMLMSVLGSTAGGLLARRIPILTAVFVTAVLRIVPLGAEWALTFTTPGEGAIVLVTCAEHFFGGALTTAMFAMMMSRVDKKIGATHFTLLAAVEVWGKAPAGWSSGLLADAVGYSTTFGLGVLLSVAFLALFIPMYRSQKRTRA